MELYCASLHSYLPTYGSSYYITELPTSFSVFYVLPKLNLPDYENNQVKIRWIGNDDVGGKRHGARKKT